MADQDIRLIAFNRGVISKRGLARQDLQRMAMSAEIQSNFIARVLGSMMLRPGMEFIDNTNTNSFTRNIPFVFSDDDKALIEMSGTTLKVRIDDGVITRPTVTATIGNSGFDFGVTYPVNSWTDASQAGGTVQESPSPGYAQLKGDGTDFGILRQTITLNESGVEHALEVFVEEGPLRFKVGSTAGDDDYVAETRLDTGRHSLAFTPTTDFTIELANEREFFVWVDQVKIAVAGDMEILTPYSEEDLPFLRWDQSNDVVYLSCKNANTTGLQYNAERLMKIERRGSGRSWSISDYLPFDGPFRVQNITGITLTPSALFGDITVTASEGVFRQEHATFNSIWRIASQGQTVTKATSADNNDSTDPIRVVGNESARSFGVIVSGTFVATVTLQFAFDSDGPWNDQGTTYTGPVSTNIDDGQDGQIIYYRLIVKTGEYTSGTVTMTLNYTGGSIQGIARARNFTSSTVMSMQVLKDFGSTDASKDWWEGEWSADRGYPTAVSLHEGRLYWAGLNKIWGSISDFFRLFDDNFLGDAGPISRSIAHGPVRIIHWLISMGRIMLGTADNAANVAAVRIDGNSPLGVRSNTFEDPLTPTNFNIKTISSKGVFVDRSKQRLYELVYNLDQQDYSSLDLSIFTPDFNVAGITQIAVQIKPDVRIHCVRTDGTVGMLIYDRLENVICWIEVNTPGASGLVEDVAVLPGDVEDRVYYTVKRTINSLTERHICKWALESEAIGDSINKIADSFKLYDSTATTTPFTTELLHLRDEEVVVWADGIDVGTHTVSATGGITLETAASQVVAGLGYTAQFKSTKLGSQDGIGFLERKKVTRLGFLAENLHYQGLKYGPQFDDPGGDAAWELDAWEEDAWQSDAWQLESGAKLFDLPQVEDGQVIPDNTVHEDYHEDNFAFGGEWDTDSRICLQAEAPRPCTILAALANMQSIEKTTTRG